MAACPLVCQCFTSIYFEFSQTFSSLLTPCACSLLSHVWLFAMLWTAVHGIFQARILEWVNLFSSRVSSQSRDRTHVSWVFCTGKCILYHCTTWKACVTLDDSFDLPRAKEFMPWRPRSCLPHLYSALSIQHVLGVCLTFKLCPSEGLRVGVRLSGFEPCLWHWPVWPVASYLSFSAWFFHLYSGYTNGIISYDYYEDRDEITELSS